MAPVVLFGQAGTTQSLRPRVCGEAVAPCEDTPARSVCDRYSGLPRGMPVDQLERLVGCARYESSSTRAGARLPGCAAPLRTASAVMASSGGL